MRLKGIVCISHHLKYADAAMFGPTDHNNIKNATKDEILILIIKGEEVVMGCCAGGMGGNQGTLR